jgi:hypothetical protein
MRAVAALALANACDTLLIDLHKSFPIYEVDPQPRIPEPSLHWRIVRAQKLNEGSHFASKSCKRIAERIRAFT